MVLAVRNLALGLTRVFVAVLLFVGTVVYLGLLAHVAWKVFLLGWRVIA